MIQVRHPLSSSQHRRFEAQARVALGVPPYQALTVMVWAELRWGLQGRVEQQVNASRFLLLGLRH